MSYLNEYHARMPTSTNHYHANAQEDSPRALYNAELLFSTPATRSGSAHLTSHHDYPAESMPQTLPPHQALKQGRRSMNV